MKSHRARRLVLAAILLIGCFAVIAIGVLLGPTPQTAATVTLSANDRGVDDPVETSHTYDMPPEQTRQVAGAVAATVLGWKVAESNPETGTIRLLAPARFGLTHDEVTATILPSGKNAAVQLVSHSLYRGLDFGSNVRHIRDLQAAMDKQLPPAR